MTTIINIVELIGQIFTIQILFEFLDLHFGGLSHYILGDGCGPDEVVHTILILKYIIRSNKFLNLQVN